MSSSFGGSGGAGAAWGALSQKCGDADGTPKGSLSPEGPYLTLTSCQREIKTIIKTHHADGRQRQHKEQRGAQSPENAPQHCPPPRRIFPSREAAPASWGDRREVSLVGGRRRDVLGGPAFRSFVCAWGQAAAESPGPPSVLPKGEGPIVL